MFILSQGLGFLCGREVEYIWFVWPGYGSGSGSTEVASMRSCQKLSLSLTEIMPAGSMMNPSLSKAKPIRWQRYHCNKILSWFKKHISEFFVPTETLQTMCHSIILLPAHPPAAVG